MAKNRYIDNPEELGEFLQLYHNNLFHIEISREEAIKAAKYLIEIKKPQMNGKTQVHKTH